MAAPVSSEAVTPPATASTRASNWGDSATLPALLESGGRYEPFIIGKWHNGMQYPYHPNGRGFDEYYGFTSGHWGHYFSPPLDHNGRRVRGSGFIVDDFTNRALQFIEANATYVSHLDV